MIARLTCGAEHALSGRRTRHALQTPLVRWTRGVGHVLSARRTRRALQTALARWASCDGHALQTPLALGPWEPAITDTFLTRDARSVP